MYTVSRSGSLVRSGAVAEHFDRITAFTGRVLKYGDDRSLGVVAERLIDLVTNCKFQSYRF